MFPGDRIPPRIAAAAAASPASSPEIRALPTPAPLMGWQVPAASPAKIMFSSQRSFSPPTGTRPPPAGSSAASTRPSSIRSRLNSVQGFFQIPGLSGLQAHSQIGPVPLGENPAVPARNFRVEINPGMIQGPGQFQGNLGGNQRKVRSVCPIQRATWEQGPSAPTITRERMVTSRFPSQARIPSGVLR